MALSGSELWPALRRREEAAESPAGGIRALQDKYLVISSTGRIRIRACGRDGRRIPSTVPSPLTQTGEDLAPRVCTEGIIAGVATTLS